MPRFVTPYVNFGGNKSPGQQAYEEYQRNQNAQNVPYAGQFAGTPYQDIYNLLSGQWQGAVEGGNKSQTTEYGRQLDDLRRFMAIFGGGPGAQFDIAQRNVGRLAGNAVGQAQSTAGALAGAYGRVNPIASILGAGTQANAPYVQAQGQIEGQRAIAQQQFLAQLLQYLMGQGQQRSQQNQFNDQNQFDWSSLLPVVGQIGAAAI